MAKLFLPLNNSFLQNEHRIRFASKNHSVEEFEEVSGMVYLSELGFHNQKSYERVKQFTLKAVKEGKISQRALWLGNYFSKYLEQGYVNDVSIHWVDKKMNYGLFTEKNLKKHEYLGEYTGYVKPCNFLIGDVNEYCFRYPLYKRWFSVYTIDAKMHGNEMSFINHSNVPNCEAVVVYHNNLFHMCLRAIEEIPKGNQLFFDYGNERITKSFCK